MSNKRPRIGVAITDDTCRLVTSQPLAKTGMLFVNDFCTRCVQALANTLPSFWRNFLASGPSPPNAPPAQTAQAEALTSELENAS